MRSGRPAVFPYVPRTVVTVGEWSCQTNTTTEPDEFGNVWVLTGLEGWWGGVDVRGSTTARPMTDGDFDGYAPRGARTVTVTGSVVSTSKANLAAAMDRVAGVLSRSQRRDWLFVDEDEVDRDASRCMMVRLGGPTTVARTSQLSAEFSLSFYSPDPVRHSAEPWEATTALAGDQDFDAINEGNIDAYPVITFVGPMVNPVLTSETGASLSLLMTIVDGDFVEVDCASRGVWLTADGEPLRASRRYLLAAGSTWLTVPADATTLFTFTSDDVTPTGTCGMGWRSAWC